MIALGNVLEELVSPDDKARLDAMSFSELSRVIRKRTEARDDGLIEGKRQSIKRTKTINIAGVGSVEILYQNDYSLEDGEPSVMQRELKGAAQSRKQKLDAIHGESSLFFIPSHGRQQAGRDYDHSAYCLKCYDG